MEEKRIELSARVRERLRALNEVEQGHLRQIDAAHPLRLIERQVRRVPQDQLQDTPARTQFDWGLAELDVECIAAQTPQAKGPLERLFGTL
jgi:hypothetical protein